MKQPAKWQPIETAPKDGESILVFSPDARDPQIFIAHYIQFEGETSGQWFDSWKNDGCRPLEDIAFTHWMPLPEIPTHYEN